VHRSISVLFLALAVTTAVFGGTRTVVPTTTLSAETGNNTSSSSTFVTQSNGNIGQANISKAPTGKLLYSGSNTPIYAHFMGWFGQTNHMNVGYTSSDPGQVQRQVADAISRGISGFLLDWYGPKNSMPNNTAFVLKSEAEAQNGKFVFGVVYDGGSLSACNATAGCDLTQQAISDLTYAYNNFEISPAYLKAGGQPVVLFFDADRYGTLNWPLIASSVPGNPLFIFRNDGGYTHPSTSGSFSWVGGDFSTHLPALSYLDNFYGTSLTYPTDQTFGSSYKGFNDTLAPWGSNRVVYQQCGQTWLQTFSQAGSYFGSNTHQLQNFQIVTWNDYEEGTEIETGIDNCFVVSPSISGNTLNWTTSGNPNSIDHYTVFISSDGSNLMSLGDVPATATSFNLGAAGMAPGTYTVYLKAVGMPSLTNKMSAAVTYSALGDLPPVPVLSVSPASGTAPLTVTASTAGSHDADGTIVASKINFGDASAVVSATSATHKYAVAGTYTVTATVTDSGGLSASASVKVTLSADKPPAASLALTPTGGNTPLYVAASTSGSYDPDGTIKAAKINFGDGTVAYAASATHTYNSAGIYTVTATVTDNAGLSASTSKPVRAYGIKVSSPVNGSTVPSSSVHVVASAYSPANYPITYMRIYVDNVSVYGAAASSLNTYVNMAAGYRHVVVQSWNSAGTVYKTSLYITVP
jgi:PKD repeat protein